MAGTDTMHANFQHRSGRDLSTDGDGRAPRPDPPRVPQLPPPDNISTLPCSRLRVLSIERRLLAGKTPSPLAHLEVKFALRHTIVSPRFFPRSYSCRPFFFFTSRFNPKNLAAPVHLGGKGAAGGSIDPPSPHFPIFLLFFCWASAGTITPVLPPRVPRPPQKHKKLRESDPPPPSDLLWGKRGERTAQSSAPPPPHFPPHTDTDAMSSSKREYYMRKGLQLQQLETEAAAASGPAKMARQVTRGTIFESEGGDEGARTDGGNMACLYSRWPNTATCARPERKIRRSRSCSSAPRTTRRRSRRPLVSCGRITAAVARTTGPRWPRRARRRCVACELDLLPLPPLVKPCIIHADLVVHTHLTWSPC